MNGQRSRAWLGLIMLWIGVLLLALPASAWADDEPVDPVSAAEQAASDAQSQAEEAAHSEEASQNESAEQPEESEATGESEADADEASQQQSPATRRTLPTRETTIPGGWLVVITYLLLWLMFGGYLVWVILRQRRLRREIDALERRIDEVLVDD